MTLRIFTIAIPLLAIMGTVAVPDPVGPTVQSSPVARSGAPSLVDVYVLPTNVNGNQPCIPPNPDDDVAVRTMIRNQLLPNYIATDGKKPGPDYLSAKNYPQGSGAYVVIATVCKTLGVYAISINGYSLGKSDDDQTSGSVSGTFDALESSDWSNLFGTGQMFPNVAFLPISNDANSIVNPRLVRNLAITLIATPAPAPIAPPPPGQPPPPLPPTTRLKECQASAYQMLIVGRTVVTSTSNDISRVIVAGSALQFKQPAWGSYYQGAGAILGLLYNPASADVSVDFFICPNKNILFSDPKDTVHKLGSIKYKAGTIYQIGGADAHITGHHVTKAIGVNPYANQVALDLATVDLANQLDCIIYRELDELQIPGSTKKQGAIYGDNDLGQKPWCASYYPALKAFEGKYPQPVSRPATFDAASQPP